MLHPIAWLQLLLAGFCGVKAATTAKKGDRCALGATAAMLATMGIF